MPVLADPPTVLTRRRVLGASLGTAAAIVMAGCAKAASQAGSGGSGKKSVTLGMPSDILLSQIMRQGDNQVFRSLVYDSLMNLDLYTEKPQPSLATTWRWNSDRTQLTLNLRDDVRYHTGRAFGPADVIFSMQKVADPASGAQTAPLAQNIKTMTASGPHQVKFTLAEPMSNFFDLLAITPIVDSQTFSDIANGTQVVGTGPFVWKNWTPGTSLSLGRNNHYWQPGKPYIDSILMRVFSSPQAMLAALESGEITMAFDMVPRDATTINAGRYRMYTSAPQFSDWYVGVNVTAPPFTDIRARQAVAYALDRDRITSQVFGDYGQPSCVPWSVTSPGLSPADSTYYTYDPAKARQLFAAAGSPKTPVPLVADSSNGIQMTMINIVQDNLASVGFQVSTQPIDSASYQVQLQAASIKGLWTGSVAMVSVSIATCVLGNAPFKVSKNTSRVTDPVYKSLAKKLVAAASTTELENANRAVTDFVLEQAFHLTVSHGQNVSAAEKSFTGVTHNIIGNVLLTSARVT